MGSATVGRVEVKDLESGTAVRQLNAFTNTSPVSAGVRSLLSGGGSATPDIFSTSATVQIDPSSRHKPLPLITRFRSIMASWMSQKSVTKVEYIPVAQDDQEDQRSGIGNGNTMMSSHKRRHRWLQSTCMLGVASLSLGLLVADVGNKIGRSLAEMRRPDPFENWGKPGTGTEDLAWYPTDFLRDVIPVSCHSHNDYWRKVPLFSALYAGCTGVEADVWLRNGDLLVGHEKSALQPNRTFQSLYINPLVDILTRKNPEPVSSESSARAMGVFDTDPSKTLVLLVDLKTDGPTTWPWVMKQLAPLRDKGWLSYYEGGQFHQRPITVVGTGNTPFDQIIASGEPRDAFFDAPLDKLEGSSYNWTNSYYASVSFWKAVGAVWWRGRPSDGKLAAIRAHIREARERGLVSRYWALPAWPIHIRNHLWKLLVEEGIGMLNVDELEAATKQDWTNPVTF